jgi:predicted membrane protein
VLGVAGAIFVFYQIGQYAQDPISTFRKVAAGVLLLSFAPDVALVTQHLPGAGWPEAFALMSMHIVVWAICLTMLPGLVAAKGA